MGVKGYPWLHSKSEASLGYLRKEPVFKEKQNEEDEEEKKREEYGLEYRSYLPSIYEALGSNHRKAHTQHAHAHTMRI